MCKNKKKATPNLFTADELHLALVTSSKAHARILKVDPSKALAMPGVVTYIDHQDIPERGSNTTGHVVHDETVFATDKVNSLMSSVFLIELALILHFAAQSINIQYNTIQYNTIQYNTGVFTLVPILVEDKI